MTCKAYLITRSTRKRAAFAPRLLAQGGPSGRTSSTLCRQAAANPFGDLPGRAGLREEVTLRRVAIELDQALQHVFGLNALADHRHSEVVREVDHAAHQRVVLAVGEADDERAIDLDLVDRQAPQVAQRRIALAEIVEH